MNFLHQTIGFFVLCAVCAWFWGTVQAGPLGQTTKGLGGPYYFTNEEAPQVPPRFEDAPGPEEFFSTSGRTSKRLVLGARTSAVDDFKAPIKLDALVGMEVWKNGSKGRSKPLVGTTVLVVDEGGAELTRARTDEDGLAPLGLFCEDGNGVWLGAMSDQQQLLGPPLYVQIPAVFCPRTRKNVHQAILEGDIEQAVPQLVLLSPGEGHKLITRTCDEVASLKDVELQALQDFWVQLDATEQGCSSAGEILAARWQSELHTNAEWRSAISVISRAHRPGVLRDALCTAADSQFVTVENLLVAKHEIEQADWVSRDSVSILKDCIGHGLNQIATARSTEACKEWSDGRDTGESPVLPDGLVDWLMKDVTDMSQESRFLAAARETDMLPKELAHYVGGTEGAIGLTRQVALCASTARDLGDVVANIQLASLAEPATNGETFKLKVEQKIAHNRWAKARSTLEMDRQALLYHDNVLSLLQQGPGCVQQCAASIHRRYAKQIDGYRDHLVGLEKKKQQRDFEQTASRIVYKRMKNNLPTYPNLRPGAERSLLEGSLQCLLLEEHKRSCLSGEIDDKICRATALSMHRNTHWDVPLPPWSVDAREHRDRFCRTTLPKMKSLPSSAQFAARPPNGAYYIPTKSFYESDDGTLLWWDGEDTELVVSSANLKAGWLQAWPVAHRAAANQLCRGLSGLTLGVSSTVCDERNEQYPGRCLVTLDECVDEVVNWCR